MTVDNLDDLKAFPAWLRLEPRCRSNDFARGLQARTADPLWMLARQWQTGEFQGEDAGTPLEVHLNYATQSLDRVRLGETEELKLSSEPFEKTVEQEWPELDAWKRVQAGQQFERFLLSELASDAQANLPEIIRAYRRRYPLDLPAGISTDLATRQFLEFMRGRVTDVMTLLADIDFSDQDSHQVLPLPGVQQTQIDRVVDNIRSWCDRLNIRPSGGKPAAWRGEQLDYRFEVNPLAEASAKKMHLVAPSYRNGDLDWYTFNVASVPAEQEQEEWNQEGIKVTPTPIRILGMSPRWWAFEDAAIAIGQMDVAKPDLAKLILMEFMLIYGDDWFGVPLPILISNLVKIDKMTVTNVFGDVTSVMSAHKAHPNALLRWEMFTLSQLLDPAQIGVGNPDLPGVEIPSNGTLAPIMLVPPVMGLRQESAPLEEIRFLRDEGANMVWAVEHIVRDGLGRPVSGFDAQRERAERQSEPDSDETKNEQESQPASADSPPRYRLATVVPENWIPFVPINARAHLGYEGMRLRRAQMLRNTDDEAPSPIPGMSRLLELKGAPLLWLEEATVPRAGLRYQLTAQRVRAVDGKTYVWLGRKVLSGRGEGSSGLRFDVLI